MYSANPKWLLEKIRQVILLFLSPPPFNILTNFLSHSMRVVSPFVVIW